MIVYHNTKYNENDFFDVIDREIDFALQVYRLYIRKIEEKLSICGKQVRERYYAVIKNYNSEQIAEIDKSIRQARQKFRIQVDKEILVFEKILADKNNSKLAKFASEYADYSKKLQGISDICLKAPIEDDYLELQKIICYYENQKYMEECFSRILEKVREYFKNLKNTMGGE